MEKRIKQGYALWVIGLVFLIGIACSKKTAVVQVLSDYLTAEDRGDLDASYRCLSQQDHANATLQQYKTEYGNEATVHRLTQSRRSFVIGKVSTSGKNAMVEVIHKIPNGSIALGEMQAAVREHRPINSAYVAQLLLTPSTPLFERSELHYLVLDSDGWRVRFIMQPVVPPLTSSSTQKVN